MEKEIDLEEYESAFPLLTSDQEIKDFEKFYAEEIKKNEIHQ